MSDPDERGPERTSTLLTTILGDYWFLTPDHIPSAALTAVLGEFGVAPAAARAALSRSTRRGRLEGTKVGRNTAYRLSPALREIAAERGRELMAFGSRPVAWDGTWTCVAFSVPEADRARRLALRNELRSLGFGALFDGTWIRPGMPVPELDAGLHRLRIVGVAVLRVTEVARTGGIDLLSAWDLDRLRRRYEDFTAEVDAHLARIEAGAVGSAEALAVRTTVLARWRELVLSDPGLPDELLPAGWPLVDARRRFVAAYDALGPLAEARVAQLVGLVPGTPPPHHHRVADLLERQPDM